MRITTLAALCLFSLMFFSNCAETKKVAGKAVSIDGTWVPVKEEMAGNALPLAVYAAQKLVIADTNYTVTAESVDKGGLRYKDGKMDIYGRSGVNAGKHFTAIYKLEQGELHICYNLMGDTYPDSYETRGKQLWFLAVYKRAH